jgi:hypothetical protein
MIIEMNVRNWEVKLVFFAWMKRHTVALLRQVFADEPYAGRVLVRFKDVREFVPPITNVLAQAKTGRERQ